MGTDIRYKLKTTSYQRDSGRPMSRRAAQRLAVWRYGYFVKFVNENNTEKPVDLISVAQVNSFTKLSVFQVFRKLIPLPGKWTWSLTCRRCRPFSERHQ